LLSSTVEWARYIKPVFPFALPHVVCSKINAAKKTLAACLHFLRNNCLLPFVVRKSICKCGWLSDRTARYPMAEVHPACGSAATVHTCNWRKRWNAFCYMGNLHSCRNGALLLLNGTFL